MLRESRAKSTAVKYDAAFSRWRTWAQDQEISPLPADPLHVALYMLHVMHSASTPSPVTSAMYAIAWEHANHGLSDPTTSDVVHRVHQAAQRRLSSPRVRKTPLSKDMLVKLFDVLSEGEELQDLLVLALITVGFAGMLRWNDLSKIHTDDIVVRKSYMAIFLESRKNDQLRHGKWVFYQSLERSTVPSLIGRAAIGPWGL